MSKSFWQGFAIGFGIVILIAIVPWLMARIRDGKDNDS